MGGLQQEVINYKELEILNQFINENYLTYCLFQLLRTPRELRKIVAFSIWISLNQNGGKNLDFVDMLILATFQYRVPSLYENLQNFSEQVINKLCEKMNIQYVYHDAALFKAKNIQKECKESLNNNLLEGVPTEQREVCEGLLRYLLPVLFGDSADAEQMLLNKKICHPYIYHTYFQYDYNNMSDEYIKLLKKTRVC